MTITVGSSTRTGAYSIVVSGNGGGLQRAVTVVLTVTAQVALSWTASTTRGVVGYNIYRSTTSSGPYTKLNSGLIFNVNYKDQTAQSGNTYYYVATSVDSQGNESSYSNRTSATVR
jgi:fibronectin type 3 domain-containing protein